jgi:hypothetical protein
MSIRIACTALGNRIKAGRPNKAGTAFIGEPQDVTSDCLKAVIEKVGVGFVETISVDDVPTYEIEVRRVSDPKGWTSTEDRLPPDETPVIILLDGVPAIGELRWEHPGYEDTYQSFRYWDNPHDDGQCWEWHQVTHWMPLPDAPAIHEANTSTQATS